VTVSPRKTDPNGSLNRQALRKDGLYNAAEKQTRSANVSQCEQISISISFMIPIKSGCGSELNSLGHLNREPLPPPQVPPPTLL
jgi:hypothetical protein